MSQKNTRTFANATSVLPNSSVIIWVMTFEKMRLLCQLFLSTYVEDMQFVTTRTNFDVEALTSSLQKQPGTFLFLIT